MTYRSEIDGLRAVAVLSVILFHSKFEWFSGGYIGVDVFFVISGYLITTIIYSSLELDKFSFLSFYVNRAKRILPVLFLVIIISLPLAFYLLLPPELRKFSQSLVSVITLTSNFFFLFNNGYFDISSDFKPLLHTWSLSVEEQFYLLYPVALFLAFKFLRSLIIPLFYFLTVLSFLLACYYSLRNPYLSFFLLPFRIWELSIGSILSIQFRKTIHRLPRKIKQFLAALGLILILVAVFLFEEKDAFNQFYLTIPVFGAAFVILCASADTFIGKFLSNRVLVLIGLLSYSAYLWHQPIFSFFRLYTLESISNLKYLGLISLTFLASYFSWRFIEVPFRSTIISLRSISSILFIGFLLILIVGVIGHQFNNELPPIKWLGMEKVPDKYVGLSFDGIECSSLILKRPCKFGSSNAEKNIVILGDSHARVLALALKDSVLNRNMSLIDLTSSGCPFLLGLDLIGCSDSSCDTKIQTRRLEYLKKIPKSIVILHSRLPLYINAKGFDNGIGGVEQKECVAKICDECNSVGKRYRKILNAFSYTINVIESLGHEVILVGSVPTNGWDPVHRLYRIQKLGLDITHSKRSELMKIPISAVLQEHLFADRLYSELKRRYPQIEFLEPKSMLCKQDYCISITQNQILYSDADHLSVAGASILVQKLVILIGT